jgi:sugar phosphate permease
MSQNAVPSHTQGYRWVILIIATLAQACASFFVQGIGAIAVFIQDGLHLTTLQIGLLVSAAQLVPVAGLLVAGELLDRYSERLVVGIGTLIVAFALMAATTASSYLSLLLFLIVVGAGYSTAQPGGSKSVSRWFAASQRGFAMGIRQAGLPLGGALAAALLPFMAARWGWQSSFLAGGLVALFGAVVFIIFYRQAPEQSRVVAVDTPLREVLASRLQMLREPSMRNIVASGVSLISVQYGVLVFTALYLHDTLGITITQAAVFLFIAQCAGVAGRILLAAWSDRCRLGRYFPVLVCMVAVIAGLLVLIAEPSASPLFLGGLFAYLGFFSFGWYGPWVAYVAESAPPDKTGFALGLAMAINQVAIVSAPPLLGLLVDTTNSYTPGWTVLIVMTTVALLTTAWSRSELKKPSLQD